jgi:hypothetical protein
LEIDMENDNGFGCLYPHLVFRMQLASADMPR